MSTDEVARLLADAAAEVPEPSLAEGAWARSRRVVRRRRAVGSGLAVAVLLGAIAVAVPARLGGPGPSQGGNPSTATSSVPVDRVPELVPQRTGVPLPRTSGDFGPKIDTLGSRPVTRAVALYEPAVAASAAQPGPVYVLGDDGMFRRIDVPRLEFAFDAGKRNRSDPLSATALSPDGKRAAFPQVDNLVVVDLTTGQHTQYRVGGFNRDVRWQGTRAVLVGQAGASFSVDLASGGVSPVQAKVADLAAGEPMVPVPAVVDQSGLGSNRITRWQGPAWLSDNLIVRAGDGSPALVAVIDTRTSGVVRVLTYPSGRTVALGWLDGHTVLLQADKGVLAWDIRSGEVTSVATPFNGTIALPSA